MFDLIIRNGVIIDGRNQPRYKADVGVQGDRIGAIGDLREAEAAQEIDATGKIVAPGFIDAHTHSDAWLLKEPHFFSKTSQGFTTEFLGLDGISYFPVDEMTIRDWIYYLRPLNGLQFDEYTGWESIGDYMALLDGKTAQNVAAFIPYANARTLACGFGQRLPDDSQMFQIKRLIQQGMEDGAMGISTGMDYVDECFATTDELVEACKMMSPHGVYVTHIRYLLGTLAGVQEAVEIGRRAHVPVHISHLKTMDDAETEELLDYIDNTAVNEVDFSFDVYPYVPSSTMLQYLLPYEVWLDGPIGATQKLTSPQVRHHFARSLADMSLDGIHIAWVGSKQNSKYQGMLLSDYIASTGKSAADALCDLLIAEGMDVLLVFHLGDNRFVEPFLAHDKYMMGSDGIYQPDGMVHPRQFGSATRLLGYYVRERQLFSLEAAIYKMTGFPAQRFGLKSRGEILEGNFADLTVFDADMIADKATFDDPRHCSVGIEYLVVNGIPILVNGVVIDGALPGRYVRIHQ